MGPESVESVPSGLESETVADAVFVASALSRALSLALLALGIHLLLDGTTEDPQQDSPWPYLALGAILAVKALVARRPRPDGHP